MKLSQKFLTGVTAIFLISFLDSILTINPIPMCIGSAIFIMGGLIFLVYGDDDEREGKYDKLCGYILH